MTDDRIREGSPVRKRQWQQEREEVPGSEYAGCSYLIPFIKKTVYQSGAATYGTNIADKKYVKGFPGCKSCGSYEL